MNSSIVPLVTAWEEFIATHPTGDLKDFAEWYIQKEKNIPHFEGQLTPPENELQNNLSEVSEDGSVLYLIQRTYRLIQQRVKPLVKKLGFSKEHEFAMLYQIYMLKSPNKKELAAKMLLETTTAVEISNRLLKKKMVKQVEDDADRRSTKLELTDLGMNKLQESFLEMGQLPAIFLAALTENEKGQLLFLLRKIENTHHLIAQ
jgi:DNA-binding MarR family transcriptional regulator